MNLKLLFTSIGYFWKKWERSEGSAPLVAGANAKKMDIIVVGG